MKIVNFYIILFYIIVNIVNIDCQQYAPVARSLHTATLVETKIYFFGGSKSDELGELLNDFFYLDISKSFDKTKEAIPFVDLSDKASEVPPHYGAATAVFGIDSIFFYGGDMAKLNDPLRLTYSFNTTQLQLKTVTVSQGTTPLRRRTLEIAKDNNDKVYVFGGFFVNNPKALYSNDLDIFDTMNKIWTHADTGLIGRDGHTATFIPDTGEIFFIGGTFGDNKLIDMNNLDVYNTINSSWNRLATKNPPELRYGHTAALTNDNRIIIFGGGGGVEGGITKISLPVNNRYVVLNTKTLEWYHGKEDPSARAPFRRHTATLYNNYMFIAFGNVYSIDSPYSNDILIYKIGDYANFTEVSSYISENNIGVGTTYDSPPTSSNNNSNNSVMIGAIIGSILGIIILGLAGFMIFKRYRKSHRIIKTP